MCARLAGFGERARKRLSPLFGRASWAARLGGAGRRPGHELTGARNQTIERAPSARVRGVAPWLAKLIDWARALICLLKLSIISLAGRRPAHVNAPPVGEFQFQALQNVNIGRHLAIVLALKYLVESA